MACEDYYSMLHLRRVTAYVLQAVQALKTLKEQKDRKVAQTAKELCSAETMWIAEAQLSLIKDQNLGQWKRQLDLFLDQAGLWRCGGRLTNADIPYTTEHPILLPQNHPPLTILIVRKAHRVQYNGVKETLIEWFWIIKGRSLVHLVIHHCVICKRFEGAAYKAPPPPPL